VLVALALEKLLVAPVVRQLVLVALVLVFAQVLVLLGPEFVRQALQLAVLVVVLPGL